MLALKEFPKSFLITFVMHTSHEHRSIPRVFARRVRREIASPRAVARFRRRRARVSIIIIFLIRRVIVRVLALAVDFWWCKNVSGRLLVGLRYWNEIDDAGESRWRFEARDDEGMARVSANEKRLGEMKVLMSEIKKVDSSDPRYVDLGWDQRKLKDRLLSNQLQNYPARPCENTTAAIIQLEQEQEPHP